MSERSKAAYACLHADSAFGNLNMALDEVIQYLEWLPDRDSDLEYTAASVKAELALLRDRAYTIYERL